MRLKDKVAIVTGAGGGMGLETVRRFIQEGAKVIAADLNLTPLKKGEINEDHLIAIKTDVTKDEQVQELVEKTVEHFGRVDILVNIAGIAQPATPIEDVTEAMWDRLMNINTKSLFLTSKAVAPHMKREKNGVIINVASISAVRPRPGLNAYVTSKGAALAFTQALAIELADFHIRVNAINPGPADTNMLGEFVAKGADVESSKKSIFTNSVPLGELIEPEDIAGAALYLSSDEAQKVTGAVFNIDGGRGL